MSENPHSIARQTQNEQSLVLVSNARDTDPNMGLPDVSGGNQPTAARTAYLVPENSPFREKTRAYKIASPSPSPGYDAPIDVYVNK